MTDVDVLEVSLVDKAANKRKFLVLKQEGEFDMPNEIVLNVEDGQEDVLKAVATALQTDGFETVLKSLVSGFADKAVLIKAVFADDTKLMDAVIKAEIPEKARGAVVLALKALGDVKADLPETVMKSIAEIGEYKVPEKIVEKIVKAEPKPTYSTIQKNEDGTFNLSGIPEEMRPMVEQLWKANEEAITKSDKLEKTLKAERDERLTRDYVAKAEGFDKLAIEAKTFGPILKSAADKLTAEEFGELERVLRAANTAASKAFQEAGSDEGDDDDDKDTATKKLEKAAVAIAKRDKITEQQAFVKAMDEHPELAKQERDERTAH